MRLHEGKLLRIYCVEQDKHDGLPLHEWIIRQAVAHGMSGATVLRGMEGFGVHHRIHTAKILRLSDDLPLVIEIVDYPPQVEAFLKSIVSAVRNSLVTLEKVDIIAHDDA